MYKKVCWVCQITKQINIGIFGGYGSVGQAVGHEIARNIDIFRKDYDCELSRLYVFGRNIDAAKYAAEQIEKSRGFAIGTEVIPHQIKNTSDKNLESIVESLDISIIAPEANIDETKMTLLEMSNINIEQIARVYAPLLSKNTGTKIVITNLTDVISYAFAQYSGNKYLDELQRWVGMNHLDTVRLRAWVQNYLVKNDNLRKSIEKNNIGEIDSYIHDARIDVFTIGPHNDPYAIFNDAWLRIPNLIDIDLSLYFVDEDRKRNRVAIEIDNFVRKEAEKHIKVIKHTTGPTVDATLQTIFAVLDESRIVSLSVPYIIGENKAIYFGLPVKFKDCRAVVQEEWLKNALTKEDEIEMGKRVVNLKKTFQSLAERRYLKAPVLEFATREPLPHIWKEDQSEAKTSKKTKVSNEIKDRYIVLAKSLQYPGNVNIYPLDIFDDYHFESKIRPVDSVSIPDLIFMHGDGNRIFGIAKEPRRTVDGTADVFALYSCDMESKKLRKIIKDKRVHKNHVFASFIRTDDYIFVPCLEDSGTGALAITIPDQNSIIELKLKKPTNIRDISVNRVKDRYLITGLADDGIHIWNLRRGNKRITMRETTGYEIEYKEGRPHSIDCVFNKSANYFITLKTESREDLYWWNPRVGTIPHRLLNQPIGALYHVQDAGDTRAGFSVYYQTADDEDHALNINTYDNLVSLSNCSAKKKKLLSSHESFNHIDISSGYVFATTKERLSIIYDNEPIASIMLEDADLIVHKTIMRHKKNDKKYTNKKS